MKFELTVSLLNEIATALENQDAKFLVDAEKESLLQIDGKIKSDNIRFYELPEWTSSNGFKLREDFVSALNAPIAKEELQEVLHSGREVFKNFRLVLKKYPEVEKKWFHYKNQVMGLYINNWYNELREIWGLEKLDYIPESDEYLIHDDFTFVDYDSDVDNENIVQQLNAYFLGEEQDLPEELRIAFFETWKKGFESGESIGQTGLICRSLSDDFAGVITASPVAGKQDNIMMLTTLFVPVNFRGLGIGTELLSMYLSKLKECGKKWILLPSTIAADIIQPLLISTGFKKVGSVYAALLQ